MQMCREMCFVTFFTLRKVTWQLYCGYAVVGKSFGFMNIDIECKNISILADIIILSTN